MENAPSQFRVLSNLPATAGWAMVGGGILVLLGWILGIPALCRLMAGATVMKSISAITFIAAGMALLAGRRRSPMHSTAAFLNILVLLIGLASLIQYAANVDLGIDHLFPDPEALAIGRPAGRMSQMTALAFVLLACQGLLVGAARAPFLAHALAGILMSLGALSLAIAGYSYQLGTIQLLPVAAPTAVLILSGTLGWLLLQPPRGIMRVAFADSPGSVLLRRLAVPALLLPPLVAILVRAVERTFAWSHVEIIATMAYLNGLGASTMVVGMAWLLHNLDRHRRSSKTFHDAAYTDALTGLANRRSFDEVIAQMIEGQRQADSGFTLLMLDIDHFKRFNDDFGHLAGDEALQAVASILRSVLRPEDLAARFGGEEFAVLLPGTGALGAVRVANRLRAALHSRGWSHRPVTASIGVASVHPGDTPVTLIARADAALYAAKSAGRDRIREEQATALGSVL